MSDTNSFSGSRLRLSGGVARRLKSESTMRCSYWTSTKGCGLWTHSPGPRMLKTSWASSFRGFALGNSRSDIGGKKPEFASAGVASKAGERRKGCQVPIHFPNAEKFCGECGQDQPYRCGHNQND